MLLPRILSAIVMVAFFFLCLFFLNETAFAVVMGGIVLVAGWEWGRLSGITSSNSRLKFVAAIGASCIIISVFDLKDFLLFFSPFVWLMAFYWVYSYPEQLAWRHKKNRLAFGIYILVSSWAALVVLKQSNDFLVWVLLLMGLIWGADSGAYFAGKAFGKRKLAAAVSPGKSWEGVIGGMLLTQVGILIFSALSNFSVRNWLLLALVALVTVAVSVLGDLAESLFKRHESLKDSGSLIPGHGGVMDRVDSLSAAAPIYVLLLSIIGWL